MQYNKPKEAINLLAENRLLRQAAKLVMREITIRLESNFKPNEAQYRELKTIREEMTAIEEQRATLRLAAAEDSRK